MTGRPSRCLLRRFWVLIRRGVSAQDAALAVGVSKRAGASWFAQAGGMPPLRLAPDVSGRHLSAADREAIYKGLIAGCSYAAIAGSIGRPTSTVTRELEANRLRPSRPRAVPLGERAGARGPVPALPNYSPLIAQQRFESRLSRPKTSKLADNPRLRKEVEARLKLNHSPEQISARLVQDFPDEPEMRVSHETIYRSLYVQGRGALKRELTKHLRTGCALRKPRRQPGQRLHRIKDMVSISQRPPEVEDRAVPGHWESQCCCQAA